MKENVKLHDQFCLKGTKTYLFLRFMGNVCVCTTQLERIVRGVKTSTTTPPGGLKDKMQLPSAEVKS